MVDDSESVREFIRRVLAVASPDLPVAFAGTVGEALIVAAQCERVHVLVTDINLTGGRLDGSPTGIDLANDLCGRDPRLRVIFISGYPEDEHRVTPYNVQYLSKPFSAQNLRRMVLDACAAALADLE